MGGGGVSGGDDSSKQMSGQLRSPGTGSKTEIHTGSCPSIKGQMSLLDQFSFSFHFVRDALHIKARKKFQK